MVVKLAQSECRETIVCCFLRASDKTDWADNEDTVEVRLAVMGTLFLVHNTRVQELNSGNKHAVTVINH
jgi:hypothetical protein